MKLQKIIIKNYRSIEEQSFVIEEKNKSHTYTLIGINESGKSSFLMALSLVDDGEVVFPRDFFDEKNPIEISLNYSLDEKDTKALNQELVGKGIEKHILSEIEVGGIEVGVFFDKTNNYARKNFERISFSKTTLAGYFFNGALPQKKTEGQEADDLDLSELFEILLPQYFYKKSHFITFWKSDPKHLIGEQINLETFLADPENVSVPLFNCFLLAKITDIKTEIESIRTDTARRQNLQDKLSDAVTVHIRKVWPNHPIKIKFNINNMMLEFLIEDDDVRYKTKTTGQRSDGFKQFISFLLTISAEHRASSLSRSLLLLDEPETHLHPKAQEFLREELITITKNKENNIVFFATHSNYMIDRDCMGRCYKVEKKGNNKTAISKIEGGVSSYAEVNYDVFGILSSDYHNELYGLIQDKSEKVNVSDFDIYLETEKIQKDKKYIKIKKDGTTEEQTLTLPSYIRNLIHHPENVNNAKFTDADLEKSTKALLKIKLKMK